jgi:hypothetical protein
LYIPTAVIVVKTNVISDSKLKLRRDVLFPDKYTFRNINMHGISVIDNKKNFGLYFKPINSPARFQNPAK